MQWWWWRIIVLEMMAMIYFHPWRRREKYTCSIRPWLRKNTEMIDFYMDRSEGGVFHQWSSIDRVPWRQSFCLLFVRSSWRLLWKSVMIMWDSIPTLEYTALSSLVWNFLFPWSHAMACFTCTRTYADMHIFLRRYIHTLKHVVSICEKGVAPILPRR